MTINLEILIIVYALSSLVLIVFSILKLSYSKQTKKGRFDLNDLTVIVPFRNEESRIVHLLNSLKK